MCIKAILTKKLFQPNFEQPATTPEEKVKFKSLLYEYVSISRYFKVLAISKYICKTVFVLICENSFGDSSPLSNSFLS